MLNCKNMMCTCLFLVFVSFTTAAPSRHVRQQTIDSVQTIPVSDVFTIDSDVVDVTVNDVLTRVSDVDVTFATVREEETKPDTTEMKTTVGERTTPEQDTTTTKNPDLTAITDVTADVTLVTIGETTKGSTTRESTTEESYTDVTDITHTDITYTIDESTKSTTRDTTNPTKPTEPKSSTTTSTGTGTSTTSSTTTSSATTTTSSGTTTSGTTSTETETTTTTPEPTTTETSTKYTTTKYTTSKHTTTKTPPPPPPRSSTSTTGTTTTTSTTSSTTSSTSTSTTSTSSTTTTTISSSTISTSTATKTTYTTTKTKPVKPTKTTLTTTSTSTTTRCLSLPGNCRRRYHFLALSKEDREHYIEVYTKVSQGKDECAHLKPAYDALITKHRVLNAQGIHGIDQFLAWHRWYLLQLENILQDCDPCITVPYWAWDQEVRPWASKLWRPSNDWFGGSGSPVGNGPFKQPDWKVTPDGAAIEGDPWLHRNIARVGWPTPAQVVGMLGMPPTPRANFTRWWRTMDNYHGTVHVRIGGTMRRLSTAANAPEFWLHHANVDRLWDKWQQKGPQHKIAASNFNAPLAGSAFTHADLHALESHAGGICVKYMGVSQRRNRHSRVRLSTKITVTEEEFGFLDIMESLDYSFYEPNGPFWKIRSVSALDPYALATFQTDHSTNKTLVEERANEIIQRFPHMVSQPTFELTPLPQLHPLSDSDKTIGAERGVALMLGVSYTDLEYALRSFDAVIHDDLLLEMEDFQRTSCIYQGLFYADGESIPSEECGEEACECSGGVVKCREADKCCCPSKTIDCVACQNSVSPEEACRRDSMSVTNRDICTVPEAATTLKSSVQDSTAANDNGVDQQTTVAREGVVDLETTAANDSDGDGGSGGDKNAIVSTAAPIESGPGSGSGGIRLDAPFQCRCRRARRRTQTTVDVRTGDNNRRNN
eukprot:m.123970 g.123970  ORF g.123970 m.123970 type:complete len:939 (+) comp14460_c0_seq1:109-2925(+)